MQTKKIVILSIFVTLMSGLFLIFPTSAKLHTTEMIRTTGTVEAIFVANNEDLVLKLKDDDRMYYVNGLDEGLTVEALNNYLSEKPVEIYYVKERNLLTPFRSKNYIAKVNINNTVLFSEGSIQSLLK